MPALQIDNLAVQIGTRPLLDGLSLGAQEGERVGIMGPSGCGKTILLRTLAGLVDAGSGRVTLNGKSGAELGWPTWRRRVAYLAQQPVMFPGTVANNLARPFKYRSATGSPPWPLMKDWLRRMGLGEATLNHPASALSVGQQQRIGLLRTLAIQPHVLLLDEPTSALDETSRDSVEGIITALGQAHGLIALVVTHQPDQAQRWCDRIVDLRDYLAAPSPQEDV